MENKTLKIEAEVEQLYKKVRLKNLKVDDHFQLLNINFRIIYSKHGIIVALDTIQQKTAQFTNEDSALVKV